jgi:DNA-binding XRE family transcriptional regulator
MSGGAVINAVSAYTSASVSLSGATLNASAGTHTDVAPINDPDANVARPAYTGCDQTKLSLRVVDLRVVRRIRERRLRIGTTQQKLAEIIGVAFQQAHNYERGLSRVSAGRLYHIATALQAPIACFFAAEDDRPAEHKHRETQRCR